jgi:hypothetical protein
LTFLVFVFGGGFMVTRFLMLAGLLLCWASAAMADDGKPADAFKSELWVNVGGFSSHFNPGKSYNESNTGFGIEYRTSPHISYMAGSYYNSVRHTTTYAAVNWQPYSLGDFKVGVAAGVMDGYPGMERGGTFFAALPLVTYEGKLFGVNFGIIPDMPKVNGAVIAQFKFRLN